uniref:TraB domain-containing protein n=1 Tax=Coccolithus braarudii TaxID=221442 RepID=A0A7S0PYG3_9EUKA|mmetsp:Transcript_26705/g.57668  ORF Transcript_26705/g.57668 Transcript_26705/m.57668 type:complete len:320 (+) Transcript_26705:59-1018(+)
MFALGMYAVIGFAMRTQLVPSLPRTRIGMTAEVSALPEVTAAPQVLTLFDPKTRSRVVLVGTMHFNPYSIALARGVVETEAAAGRLRAVAVESCPSRWNATLYAQPPGSMLRLVCDNEMQAAAEAAEAEGVSLALVDQTIEEVGRRVVQMAALTFVELLTPWNGGWSRIGEDLAIALRQVGGGDDGTDGASLGVNAFLDPRILAGLPLSLIRYPLSIGLKSPALLSAIALAFYGTYMLDMATEDSLGEFAGAAAFAVVETIFLGRLLLVVLLEERNFVLARNIRKACFASKKPGGSIVAVLGMAHLNGVAALLRDSRVV